jgi:hypothetical protein
VLSLLTRREAQDLSGAFAGVSFVRTGIFLALSPFFWLLVAGDCHGVADEWMLLPYRRYFEFSGRSRRKEYWMFACSAFW